MNNLNVHLMHVEVSAALERLSTWFKPGMKITFIARLPGNGEADVLIGDDHDADEIIALVRRRFGVNTEGAQAAPEEVRNQALDEAADKLDAMNDASGDAASYDNRDQYSHELEREHAISDCAKAIRALRTSTDQADTDTGSAA